jgi:predicted HNH restriction endonuclease
VRVRRAQYLTALAEIQARGGPSGAELRMLRAHWAAPRQTVSMGQLAIAAAFPKHSHANLQYGGLAKRIAKYGSIAVPKGHIFLNAIANWGAQPFNSNGHFAFSMRRELSDALEELGLVDGAEAVPEFNTPFERLEGEEKERLTRHRARESSLRMAKLKQASAKGRIRCEVPGCGFDFEKAYGELGRGFAEVHHLRPLAHRSGPELTRLSDLAVVCSNCHSMIHRFGACRPLVGLRRTGRTF